MASPMRSGRRVRRPQGFTYVALLIAVATVGGGAAATAELWSQSERREKERELLFAGAQFREAVRRYYEASPGVAKGYPQHLDDLLADKRFPQPRRHLRRMYRDPITGKAEWAVVESPQGGIMGVRSLSDGAPLKTGGFAGDDALLVGATRYSEWRFTYNASLPTSPNGPHLLR
jgi:type II secretory pathway pseudopilin PulG